MIKPEISGFIKIENSIYINPSIFGLIKTGFNAFITKLIKIFTNNFKSIFYEQRQSR